MRLWRALERQGQKKANSRASNFLTPHSNSDWKGTRHFFKYALHFSMNIKPGEVWSFLLGGFYTCPERGASGKRYPLMLILFSQYYSVLILKPLYSSYVAALSILQHSRFFCQAPRRGFCWLSE